MTTPVTMYVISKGGGPYYPWTVHQRIAERTYGWWQEVCRFETHTKCLEWLDKALRKT